MSDKELRTKILDYIVDSMPDLGTDADVIIAIVREDTVQRCIDATKPLNQIKRDLAKTALIFSEHGMYQAAEETAKTVDEITDVLKALEAQK